MSSSVSVYPSTVSGATGSTATVMLSCPPAAIAKSTSTRAALSGSVRASARTRSASWVAASA
ncbi:hypothetical protein [Kitasatospora mediocidica]|uniref:hypothetical protein n=1 Tax=Kitasatospora mediocidica TaxID=58352 RepID=UPI000560E2F8